MKISIELAMLVRMTKVVIVEVPDNYRKAPHGGILLEDSYRDLMRDVYEADDGVGFKMDDQWGCEEGTHSLVKLNAEGSSDYRLVAEASSVDEECRVEKVPFVNRETVVVPKGGGE